MSGMVAGLIIRDFMVERLSILAAANTWLRKPGKPRQIRVVRIIVQIQRKTPVYKEKIATNTYHDHTGRQLIDLRS